MKTKAALKKEIKRPPLWFKWAKLSIQAKTKMSFAEFEAAYDARIDKMIDSWIHH